MASPSDSVDVVGTLPFFPRSDRMKAHARDLSDTTEELAQAKKVLRAAQKKVEKVKKGRSDKLEKKNAKLAAETIKNGVEFVADRRDTLQKQVEHQDKMR